ncbi:MAG: FAD-binding oxidoreductase [Chloroflexota bacterium]
MIASFPPEHRFHALPAERLATVEGWGMLDRSAGYVYRPSTIEGVLAVLDCARTTGHSVTPRGTGYSYGDASLNRENIVLDLTRMNRVLAWDPGRGIIRVEPGVTVRRLWEYTIEDGWWPAVVPGAMYPTLGGCAAVNVHGKNNWHAGPISEHILALDMVLPSGECIECSATHHADLFRAALGGLGMLGIIVGLTIQMKPISSGLLQVRQIEVPSLDDMFELFDQHVPSSDYLVGWIDAFSTGRRLGRGLLQAAKYVHDDPHPSQTLRASFQHLPDTVLGVMPRSKMWLGMKAVVNNPGMRLLNRLQYAAGSFRSGTNAYVPHAQFHFFHDFVPDWKRSFTPGGILQYQIFVPADDARSVFASLLSRSQVNGSYPYLAVFKRHRSDSTLLRYNVDGYSLSLDYRAHPHNSARLRSMLSRFTRDLVLPAGGRFYPAKDNLCAPGSASRIFGPAAVNEYLALKDAIDPDALLQSDLFRRLFITDTDAGARAT